MSLMSKSLMSTPSDLEPVAVAPNGGEASDTGCLIGGEAYTHPERARTVMLA